MAVSLVVLAGATRAEQQKWRSEANTEHSRVARMHTPIALFINYALLAVTKHEQWHFQAHARSHAGMHTHVHVPIDPSPRSQICLQLLSKPAVKSSIICIAHLGHCSHVQASNSPPPPSPAPPPNNSLKSKTH